MDSEITRNRTAHVSLTIRREDQAPLRHGEVCVQQTKHKFLFGTAAFDIVALADGEYSEQKKEATQQRAEKLGALFNAATLPFYWARFEPQRGKPMTRQLTNAARWCVDHGISVKGHPLCWHTLTADWLLSMNTAEILRAQTERIRRDVTDARGLIDMWDVINEAVIMPVFDKYDNGITRLCREIGRIPLVKAMFSAARAANPSAILLINDFDVSPAYDILVEGCLEAGIQIDVIGIQSHMHQGYWGIEKTLKVLDQFSRFHLPIHFTETTLVSGQLMPPEFLDLNDYKVREWPTTPEGEDRQAREAIQYYATLFSQPLVEGITWWDIADGGWLNAPGGLLRRDGSNKPAYDELMKLIKGEWWVVPTKLTTDENGRIDFTAFLGDYELTVGHIRKPFSVRQPGESAISLCL